MPLEHYLDIDTDILPPVDTEHHTDTLIATAIAYASINDPTQLRQLLGKKIQRLNYTDDEQASILAVATLIEKAHAEQQRKERNAPFVVHPYAVGLMAVEFVDQGILPFISANQLAVALCHDVIEDGIIDGEPITQESLHGELQAMGGLNAAVIAHGVHVLSNVETHDGSRVEIDDPRYYRKIAADFDPLDRGVQPLDIKVADRVLANAFDPSVDPSPKALEKRRKKAKVTSNLVIPTFFATDPQRPTRTVALRGMQVSNATLPPHSLDLHAWARPKLQFPNN
jgi:hypothetical protein